MPESSRQISIVLTTDDVLNLLQTIAATINALHQALECHEREGRMDIAAQAKVALEGFETLLFRFTQAVRDGRAMNHL